MLYSQTTFSKSIDVEMYSDVGTAIRLLQDGYLVIANSVCFSNPTSCYTYLKTDFEGNVLWQKQLTNYPYKIQPASHYNNYGAAISSDESSFYFCGLVEVNGAPADIFLMKTDASGDSLWLKTYGGPFVDVAATVFFRTDTTLLLYSDYSLGPNNNDVILLLETDLEGNIIWEGTYGDESGMVARMDILQFGNGDIVFNYLSCNKSGSCTAGDEQILKVTRIDSAGEELWTSDAYYFNKFGTSSMVSLDDGGYLLSFHRDNPSNGFLYPPILIWLDSMGNFVKQYDFPEDTESWISSLTKTSSGIIVGSGFVDKWDLGFAGWVFAMSQEGDLLWNREIIDYRFPARANILNAVAEAENGGLILTGFIMDTFLNNVPGIYNQNIWLLKLDSSGCLEPGCGDLQTVNTGPAASRSTIALFPNPAGPSTNVVLPPDTPRATFSLYDLTGHLVLRRPLGPGLNEVPLDAAGPGFYLYEVNDGEKRLMSGKLVKVE